MNVGMGTDAAQFPFWENINWIYSTVCISENQGYGQDPEKLRCPMLATRFTYKRRYLYCIFFTLVPKTYKLTVVKEGHVDTRPV
jgi:hypothetical protein